MKTRASKISADKGNFANRMSAGVRNENESVLARAICCTGNLRRRFLEAVVVYMSNYAKTNAMDGEGFSFGEPR